MLGFLAELLLQLLFDALFQLLAEVLFELGFEAIAHLPSPWPISQSSPGCGRSTHHRRRGWVRYVLASSRPAVSAGSPLPVAQSRSCAACSWECYARTRVLAPPNRW